jgi:hypothetical protein
VRGETESDCKIGALVGRVSNLVKDSSHVLPAFLLERSCERQAARLTSVAHLDWITYCLVIGLAATFAGAAIDPHADNLSRNVMCIVPIIRS